MALVNIRAKETDVGETEMVSQKKLKMAQSISDGEINASYVFEKLRETTEELSNHMCLRNLEKPLRNFQNIKFNTKNL